MSQDNHGASRGGVNGGNIVHTSSRVSSIRSCSQPSCRKKLNSGTRGSLCRDCYRGHPQKTDGDEIKLFEPFENNEANYESLQLGDSSTLVSNLTVSDFAVVIRHEMEPMVDMMRGIQRKIATLEQAVDKITADYNDQSGKIESLSANLELEQSSVTSLKKVILEQQKCLESIRKKELSNNAVISGIPNTPLVVNGREYESDTAKLEAIFGHMDCANLLLVEHKVLNMPVRDGSTTHTLKVQFDDKNNAKTLIEKAKGLKTFDAAKIFINYDEPFISRKEHNRLRKKKYDLTQDNPDDNIKISKGKLLHNNTVVDRFDLSNQLF